MTINNILGQSAFWIVNKKLASEIGLEESILLSDFISKQHYFTDRGELIDGFFFNTALNIETDTGLKYRRQKRVLKTLTEMGLVSMTLIGVPAKLYFRVHEGEVAKLIGLADIIGSNKAEPQTIVEVKKNMRSYADEIPTSDELDVLITRIYDEYPTKCVVRGASTGKGRKNRLQIEVLLRTVKAKDILDTINWYLTDCTKSKVYMKNFSTFLNNLPEIPEGESTTENGVSRKSEIRNLLRWLTINYGTKKADAISDKKARELMKLGYKNQDFLKEYLYEK